MHVALRLLSLRFIAPAAVAALLLTGCDSLESSSDRIPAELRFEAAPMAVAASKSAGPVVVEEAKLLIKTVKFHYAGGEEFEFKTESFVVSLTPGDVAQTVATGAIPPGDVRRVTFVIHKPEDTEPVPDPEFRTGTSGRQRFSMIIRGRVDGEPFTLRIDESFSQRVDLAAPLSVAEGDPDVAVTLRADVSQWFTDRDGRALDPRIEDDADEIGRAIKDSFRALGTRRSND